MLKQGVNIVLDAQWGSTGKGKLGGYLGRFNPTIAATSFGPNAGHTYVDNDGNATVFKYLSSAAFVAGCPSLVLPDSVLVPEDFLKEVEVFGGEVLVHPRAAIVVDDDAAAARVTGKHLAGTQKGTGHAISRKILRIKGTRLAKDVLPSHLIADTCGIIRHYVSKNEPILVEMSQGFDLSVNHGHEYPYLTSRDITVGAAINSAGISHRDVSQVIGCMRTFPIRVGNVEGGWSGPCHADQTEITWKDVANGSGGPDDLVEVTTVTKRVRRVFTFSMIQLKRFVAMNKPDWMFLNFIQYFDHSMQGVTKVSGLTEKTLQFINNFERETGVRILLAGTGAKDNEIVTL